jgi:hypothetical protein
MGMVGQKATAEDTMKKLLIALFILGISAFAYAGAETDSLTVNDFTLPASDGTADQVLTTDGAGTVSWQDPSGGGTPDDASVSQAKLKTSTGEVSTLSENLLTTLPGGEYGFYPQGKISAAGSEGIISCLSTRDYPITGTSYATYIFIGLKASGGSRTVYAQQRYITSSGRDHWIFLLVDKTTGQVIGGYEAPDHPSYGNGGDETKLIHPFCSIDEATQEVVLVDNKIITQLKPFITRQNTLLTLINERCLIDDTKRPKYEPREIIELDEFGDLRGEVILTGKTPDWAKIKIMKDEYELKRRMVETLPETIKYRELKLKD